jgi:excisionase family DNA binding protein
MSEITPRYISIEKAAAALDTSPRTVRRLIASGELKGYRVGKRLLRIDVNDLEAITRRIPTAS